MHSSGVTARILDDVLRAVEQTVVWSMGSNDHAQSVLQQFPLVLGLCDELDLNEPGQALANLILHLPDRLNRMWSVLEQLLVSGRVPLGKCDGFAALAIGTGPAPELFAVRSFYAALARYAAMVESSIVPLGRVGLVEQSDGMVSTMHHFAEALVLEERRDDAGQHPWGGGHVGEQERSTCPLPRRSVSKLTAPTHTDGDP